MQNEKSVRPATSGRRPRRPKNRRRHDEKTAARRYSKTDKPVTLSTHPAFTVLLPQLQRAIAEEGYLIPTPIQAQAIPRLLEGRDLIGCAQTGTGKTAAFTLPILQYLKQYARAPKKRRARVLIMTPTRELAAQIGDSVSAYGRHLRVSHAVIFGGVGQMPQVTRVKSGIDIIVATPGRLLDLMNQGHLQIDTIEIFVLDEADRMLDMGFLPDIKRIIAKLPRKRQSLFFSATMAKPIVTLAKTLVVDPIHITVTPDQPAVERIVQKMMFVDRNDKNDLLISILKNPAIDKVLVFTAMKHVANRVTGKLHKAGITAAAIHGNKSQTARTKALAGFKTGQVRVLVATDIAARGIDVFGISHVINYDLPNEPETYVHRIGRTARAEADGDAISFCSARERAYLRDIENLLKTTIPVDTAHRHHSEQARNAAGAEAKPLPKQPRPPRARRQSSPRAAAKTGARNDRQHARKSSGKRTAPRRPQ